jgi:hypothetical protein
VRPGREHDTTAVRTHTEILPVFTEAAGDLRRLGDLGYEGEANTITVAFKKPRTAPSMPSSSSSRPITLCAVGGEATPC